MVIDFHTHTFPETIAERTVKVLAGFSHTVYYNIPSIEHLIRDQKAAGVDMSVNLPVMTKESQVVSVNDKMIEQNEYCLENGVITFGGLHPDHENYAQELKRLKSAGIKGIKLHPAYQGCDLTDIRNKRIIEKASELGLIVLIHAGLDIGIPNKDYASIDMILEIVKEIAPEKFVLAHMGGWQNWDNVEKYLSGAPVYFDTAFSLGEIEENAESNGRLHYKYNLSEEGFAKLVRAHGSDKVLYASDLPWSSQKKYIDFIKSTDLTEEEKEQIFYKNAASLLGLKN